MNFYIALCPHFHQPHFQPEDVLKTVLQKSYQPWLSFLDKAIKLDPDFTINAHLSGPLLQHALRSAPEFIAAFRKQIAKGVVKIVGGLADESFPQLSSRPDDTTYQISLYQELVQEAFGLDTAAWDAFHIPERECGENLIMQLTRALARYDVRPLFYLDVETFYAPPPAEAYEDPTLRAFGAVAPLPSFNESALHGIYRDEILGREFFIAPIHARLRQFFLKRKSLHGTDPACSPAQYVHMVREKALEAGRLIQKKSGREIPPLMLVFTDAEVLGQWSNEPEADIQWLVDFVGLVKKDPDARFTTLRGYFDTFGFVDTYPIKTSTSHPEFENWSMRRGIRGLSYVDPQLRRVISVLRGLEETQERIERIALDRAAKRIGKRLAGHPFLEDIQNKVLGSHSRYALVRRFLQEYWGPDETKGYDIINRIRNLVYQEDPRWTSRHPSPPSSDLTGLGYCAVAQKIGDALIERLTRKKHDQEKTHALLKDWDKDGNDEAVITNHHQTLVISQKGGTIIYHQIHSPYLKNVKYEDLLAFGADILTNLPTSPAIGFYSQCLLHTEADSDLSVQLDARQSRVECCRDSLRLNVLTIDGADMVKIGETDTAMFAITDLKQQRRTAQVELSTVQRLSMRSETLEFSVRKVFVVDGDAFAWRIVIERLSNPDSPRWKRLLFAPEIVNSIIPGDEIEGRMESLLCLHDGGKKGTIRADIQQTVFAGDGFDQRTQSIALAPFSTLSYAVFIRSPRYGAVVEEYAYLMKSKTAALLRGLVVTPAVRRFHHGYVFDKHSRVGFHQSGVKIQPIFALSEGVTTTYEVSMERHVHEPKAYTPQGTVIALIKT